LGKIKPSFKPYEGENDYIFISYAHKDEKVKNLIQQLHDRGYRIWYDKGIKAGTKWRTVIQEHMQKSSLILTFLSPNAIESDNVMEEFEFAKSEKFPMVTVLLSTIDKRKYGLGLLLNSIQYIKYDEYSNDNLFFEELFSSPLFRDKLLYEEYELIAEKAHLCAAEAKKAQVKAIKAAKTAREINTSKNYGVCVWNDGRKYEGEWKNRTISGYGVYTYNNGTKYEGEWKDSMRNNYGVCIWNNGVKYEGMYKEGKRNGYGINTYFNNSTYEGEYKDDKRNGYGILYDKDNNIKCAGLWKDSEFIE